MAEAVLALGSNLGDRAGYLREAVHRLEESGWRVVRRSAIWETDPVPADQPAFLNAVIVVEAGVATEPRDLLALVKTIESELGRTPTRRWGPRVIDIDILFFGETSLNEPDLIIPHERISERAFVLAPLAEVTDGPLPVLGQSAIELLAALEPQGIRRSALKW